jgi:hypothetical protein
LQRSAPRYKRRTERRVAYASFHSCVPATLSNERERNAVPDELEEQLEDLAQELRDPNLVIARSKIRESKARSWKATDGVTTPPIPSIRRLVLSRHTLTTGFELAPRRH